MYPKGKRNKLKLGDRVKAKQSLVDWCSSHLSWSYGRKTNDPAYSKDEKEISVEDLSSVYLWSLAKLGNKMPRGAVDHYGASDNDEGVDRNNVYINFTFKTELGNMEYGAYVHEKDLELVKRKKPSKGKRP